MNAWNGPADLRALARAWSPLIQALPLPCVASRFGRAVGGLAFLI